MEALWLPRIIGKTVSKEVEGTRLNLQRERDMGRHGLPGVDIGGWLMQEKHTIIALSPPYAAYHGTPGQSVFDRVWPLLREFDYAPHSECL